MRIKPGTTVDLYSSPALSITLTRSEAGKVYATVDVGGRRKTVSDGSLEAFSETLAYWLAEDK